MASQIVPFYLVVDENVPKHDVVLDGLNSLWPVLKRTADADSALDTRTRLCTIGFSSTARMVRPLASPSSFQQDHPGTQAADRTAICFWGR